MIQYVIFIFIFQDWFVIQQAFFSSSYSLLEILEEYFIHLKALIIFLLCNWMNKQIHMSKHTFKIYLHKYSQQKLTLKPDS